MTDLLTMGEPPVTDKRCTECDVMPDEQCPIAKALMTGFGEKGEHVPAKCPRDVVVAEPTDASRPATAVDDASASDADTDAKLAALVGELTQPENTSGVYVVLWAQAPDQSAEPAHRHRPAWQEVGYFTASSPDVARARSIEHDGRNPPPADERGPVAQFLIEQARTTVGGIMLRALPAMHWPVSCPVTSYRVPAPILTLDS